MTRAIRAILAGIAAGVLIAVWLRGTDRFGVRRGAAAPPASAEQQLTQEIFRANLNRPSDPDLASAYRALNTTYFESRLPDVRIRWEPRLAEVGPLIAEGFRMGGVTDGRIILINPAVRDEADELARVLCHEAVHIAAIAETDPHGPIFQGYLRQLLDRGAFRGIVATDEEKQARRKDLERLSADLAAEADLLARMKAALEADAGPGSSRPEELTARTSEYNDRVRRHNDAVVAFDHAIEEYNQMVSYPDGLDRERLEARRLRGERD